MSEFRSYEFTLVLTGANEKTAGLEDHLFEAGCDDALIHFKNGGVYLDFVREASSLEKAVLSAIKAVENTPLSIKVLSVAPEDFVSESDMAKRLNIGRQAVSLWVKGARRAKKPFPSPIVKISSKSPLWKWVNVIEWLIDNRKIQDSVLLNNAKFFEGINLALVAREKPVREYQQQLLRKINRL